MTESLEFDARLHEIIRQNSIRNIMDALVELITNSDDAYEGRTNVQRNIWVQLIRGQEKSQVIVVDQGRGMTDSEMKENLLTVGKNTSVAAARGMMGRGAKDVSVLGDVRYQCIHDNRYSSLTIKQDRSIVWEVKDQEVTEDDRASLEINNNGCRVTLTCNSTLVPSYDDCADKIKNNIYLRTLLTDPKLTLLLIEGEKRKHIVYQYPKGKRVFEAEYIIDEYQSARAQLEIWVTEEEMSYSPSPDTVNYGIIVGSGRAVYECSALWHQNPSVQDYMWNPNMKYVYGRLNCNKIDELAREAIAGNITGQNPFLILDSNRRNGLYKDHPFTKALYSHAYHVLQIIINRLQDRSDDNLLEANSAKDIFDGLNSIIENLLPPENFLYTFRTREDQNSLNKVLDVLQNVKIDNDFMGLTWEQLQELSRNKVLQTERTSLPRSSFHIAFTTDPNLKSSYQFNYYPGRVVFKINARDPIVSPWVEVTDKDVKLVNTGKALTAVGSILVDGVNSMAVRRKIMNGETRINIDNFNEYQFNYNEIRRNMSGRIFANIRQGITDLKVAKESTN